MEFPNNLHPDTTEVLKLAARYAQHHKAAMGPATILFAMISKRNLDDVVRRFLSGVGVNIRVAELEIELPYSAVYVPMEAIVLELMNLAAEEAKGPPPLENTSGQPAVLPVRVVHLFMAMLRTDNPVSEKLTNAAGIHWSEQLRATLIQLQAEADAERKDLPPRTVAYRAEGRPRLKADSALLANGAVDLTRLAEEGKLEPYFGGEDKIDFMIAVLCRKLKPNPCITGIAGTGKTSMVKALAQRIVAGTVPPPLQDAIIISIDFASLLTNTVYRGQFEERMKAIIEEWKANPNYILFIDELHTMVGAGETKGGALDASNILKPALASEEYQLRCIGATTGKEFRAHIAKDRALRRRFQEIALEEPSVEDAQLIMVGAREVLERWHKANIPNEVLFRAVQLAFEYLRPRGEAVIDAAKTLLDTACSARRGARYAGAPTRQSAIREQSRMALRIKLAEREPDSSSLASLLSRANQLQEQVAESPPAVWSADEVITLTTADVEAALRLSKNITITSAKETLSNLRKVIESIVIGQSGPISSVVQAVQVASLFKQPNKPIGSFLFLGPTGVGKTEVARALALALFNDADALIRLDMSEYMEKHTVSRLIGAPPGYVGFDQEGALTEPVNRRPHCVLLLDEIEKAHPDVWNILLQVMDYGRLTDAQGNPVDFSHVILIMTSNVGQEQLTSNALFDVTEQATDPDSSSTAMVNKDKERKVIESAKTVFTPEWLNRLTAICVFNLLTEEDIGSVTPLKVQQLVRLVEETQKIKLSTDQSVLTFLAKKGFSKDFGARELLRTIYKYITVPLAEAMLSGEIHRGDTVEAIMNKSKSTLKVEFRKIA